MTKAWLRPRAESDLVERTQHYGSVGGHALAERFFDAALAALRSAERMPQAGSPRLGELCDLPGLRSWPVERFGCRWYYFVDGTRLDVVRLLADAQDLIALLGDEDA